MRSPTGPPYDAVDAETLRVNRLIGDALSPGAPPAAFVTVPACLPTTPPRESGLVGTVTPTD